MIDPVAAIIPSSKSSATTVKLDPLNHSSNVRMNSSFETNPISVIKFKTLRKPLSKSSFYKSQN